jgi:hypothetical protein
MTDPRLVDALPDLAEEVRILLGRADRADLTEQVDALLVVDRCRCANPFCATVLTAPPEGAGLVGGVDGTVTLHPERGLLFVDVIDGWIETVQVLFRPEIRERVRVTFP